MKMNTMTALRGVAAAVLTAAMLALVSGTGAYAATPPVTVSVPATADGVNPFDSGVVLTGNSVTVSATGTWNACDPISNNPACASGPDGTSAFGTNFTPLNGAFAGALVARVGAGPWTLIGAGPTTISGTGALVFADNDGGNGDNSGSLSVSINPVIVGGTTVNVPATADGVTPFSSGITLTGNTVTVTATGTWNACDPISNNPACASGPDGTSAFGTNFTPLNGAFAGALVARVGSGPWVLVGSGPTAITGTGLLVFADNDGGNGDNSGSLAVTISGATPPPTPAPTLTGPTATAQVGVAYSSALTATGGVPPYTYSIPVGSLPAGLTLNPSTGAITGTPSAAGAVSFTAQVVDSRNNAAGTNTLAVTITVAAAPVGTVVNIPAQSGEQSPVSNSPIGLTSSGITLTAAQSYIVTATGTWEYCPGCSVGPQGNPLLGVGGPMLNGPAGALVARVGSGPWIYIGAGPTTVTGVGLLQFAANDGWDYSDNSGSVTATIVAGLPIVSGITVTPPSGSGTVAVAYSSNATASGGTGPYTYAVTSGSVPPGLTFSAGGALTGVPTVAGTYTFTVTATDAASATGTVNATVTITAATSNAVLNVPATSGDPSVAGSTGWYGTGIILSGGSVVVTSAGTWDACGGGCPSNGGGASAIGTGFQPLPSAFANALVARVGSGPWVLIGTGPTVLTGTGEIQFANNDGGNYTDNTGSLAVTIAGASAPVVTITVTGPSTTAQVGTAYSSSVTATGGTGPYTYAVTAGALPAGLTMTSAGVITGTPTTAGPVNFTVTATDSASHTGTVTVTMTVAPAPVVTITVTPPTGTGTVGVSYTSSLTASGGTGPYTYAVTGGALPAGLTLSAAGALTGTPTAAGTSNFTVTATDSASHTGTVNASIVIAAGAGTYINIPAQSGAMAPVSNSPIGFTSSGITLTLGQTYVITASGSWHYCDAIDTVNCPAVGPNGTFTQGAGGPIDWTVGGRAGVLVARVGSGPWVAIGAGPTTVSGVGLLEFAMNDGYDYTDNSGSVIAQIVAGPPLPTPTLAGPATTGTVGTAYSSALTASGGTGAYTYSILSGALPGGLTLNPTTGAITGTPTTAGTFSFVGKVVDANGMSATVNVTIVISAAATPVVPTLTTPGGTVGTAYTGSAAATGGTGPYTFAVTGGSLPAGLTLNTTTGAITGTPTAAGTSNFTVTATDSLGATGTVNGSIVIVAAATPVVPTLTTPGGTVGTAYTGSAAATGGTGPYTFAVTGGSLPAGLTLNTTTGAITGTPTAAGTSNFTVTATDSLGATGTVNGSIVIVAAATPVVPTLTTPGGTVGTAYTGSAAATGGTGPYTFAVTGGSLPAGLTLNTTTGAITGTPTAAGTSNFTVTATDSLGATGTVNGSIVIVAAATPVVPTLTTPGGTVGTAYTGSAAATGGTGPYTFAVTGGSLPAGLTLNTTTGAITGTPTAAGTSNFTVTATDSLGATGTVKGSIVVSAVATPTDVCSHTGGNIVVNGCFESNVVTNGSGWDVFKAPPLVGWTVTWLNANACLAGEPGYTGAQLELHRNVVGPAYEGQQYAELDSDCNGPANESRNGEAGSVRISQTLPTVAGQQYLLRYAYKSRPGTVAGTNGIRVRWNGVQVALTGDAADWTLKTVVVTATGATSTLAIEDAGTADSMGSFIDDVRVTPAPAVVPTLTTPGGTVGTAYTGSAAATGGTGPYTFAVTGGSLPTGLSMSTSGAITGTPTAAGTSNFTVTATDSLGVTGIVNGSIVIVAAGPTRIVLTANACMVLEVLPSSAGYTSKIRRVLPTPLTELGVTNKQPGTIVRLGSFTSGTELVFGILVTDTGKAFVMGPASSNPDNRVHAQVALLGANQWRVNFEDIYGTGDADYNDVIFVVRPGDCPAPAVTLAETTPDGTVGAAYTGSLTAGAGTAPYAYSLLSGSLPGGLTLNASTGAITGTPTTAGTFNFVGKVTDGASQTATVNASITIVAGAYSVCGTVGSSHDDNRNGAPGHEVERGSTLPVRIQICDANGRVVTSRTLVVKAVSVTTGVLQDAGNSNPGNLFKPVGVDEWQYNLSTAGYVAGNYTLDFTVGTNPTVLHYPFTVRLPVPPVALAAYDGTGKVGVAFSQALTVTGGTAPYTFALTGGSLPGGLTLNASTGVISGTPTTAGTFTFKVTVTGTAGGSDTREMKIKIEALAPVNLSTLDAEAKKGVAYSKTLTVTGGLAPYTFAVTGGALPTGLTLNTSTGVISGTPTVAGTFTFKVTATASVGGSDTENMKIKINN